MRTDVRAVRSLLTAFAPLFDADQLAVVTRELSLLSHLLGANRDPSVVAKRVKKVAAKNPDLADVVESYLIPRLTAGGEEASQQLLSALALRRYGRLLDALMALANSDDEIAEPASQALPSMAELALERLLKARAESAKLQDNDAAVLHRVRKQAKLLYFAGGSVRRGLAHDPGSGRGAALRAGKVSRQAKAVADVLGQHQDAVMVQDELLAAARDANPEVAFALGRLYAMEDRRRRQSRLEFRRLWRSKGFDL